MTAAWIVSACCVGLGLAALAGLARLLVWLDYGHDADFDAHVDAALSVCSPLSDADTEILARVEAGHADPFGSRDAGGAR